MKHFYERLVFPMNRKQLQTINYYVKTIMPHASAEASDKSNAYEINKYSKDIKMAILERNGMALEFIHRPTYEMKMTAVETSGNALQFIKNPDYDLKMTAVEANGYAIQWIKSPDEALQHAAVKECEGAYSKISKPLSSTKELYEKLYVNPKYENEFEQMLEHPSMDFELDDDEKENLSDNSEYGGDWETDADDYYDYSF